MAGGSQISGIDHVVALAAIDEVGAFSSYTSSGGSPILSATAYVTIGLLPMGETAPLRREVRTVLLALLILATSCSGHAQLSDAIDALGLPDDLVEVGEEHGGESHLGDRGHVIRYYASPDDVVATCETMRLWSADRGLSEADVPADSFTACYFSGVIDSNQVHIHVTPPNDPIHPVYQLNPIPVDIEHGAIVQVEVY